MVARGDQLGRGSNDGVGVGGWLCTSPISCASPVPLLGGGGGGVGNAIIVPPSPTMSRACALDSSPMPWSLAVCCGPQPCALCCAVLC